MSSSSQRHPVLASACARRRARNKHHTEFTHHNLAVFIGKCLPPAWTVIEPPELDETVSAPSQFPEETDAVAQTAARDLLSSALPLTTDWEDVLNGHCESCAALTSEFTLKAIQEKQEGCPLAQAYRAMSETLKDLDTAGQVRLLLGPQARAAHKDRRGMWKPMWHQLLAAIQPEHLLQELCAGACESLPDRLRAVAIDAEVHQFGELCI